VELTQPHAGWHALDIATGAGHTAFAFAPYVARVTASDLTPEMLIVAEKLAMEKGLTNVDFKEADAEHLPFDEATFDLVTCRIAPHHFPDIVQFLRECARILKPGGVLAVVDNIVPGDQDETVREFYRLLDAGTPPFHLFTADFQFHYPKFGVGHGVGEFVELAMGTRQAISRIAHRIDNLLVASEGSCAAAEGVTEGVDTKGKEWRGGETSGGQTTTTSNR
jgi:SAM-dependent methyltransferase